MIPHKTAVSLGASTHGLSNPATSLHMGVRQPFPHQDLEIPSCLFLECGFLSDACLPLSFPLKKILSILHRENVLPL